MRFAAKHDAARKLIQRTPDPMAIDRKTRPQRPAELRIGQEGDSNEAEGEGDNVCQGHGNVGEAREGRLWKDRKEPCVVVALSSDKVSFADIVVGVLTPRGDSFRTTHLLLVQAKHYSTSTLSVLKEWVEMRRMGSDAREAVIAGCVAQLTRDSCDDAMKPLIISADTHHETFKEARKAFYKEMSSGHKLLFKFPSAETMDKLFKPLCGDDNVAVRSLTPYKLALESNAQDGPQTFVATLAKFLGTRSKTSVRKSLGDVKILRSAKLLPDEFMPFLPRYKRKKKHYWRNSMRFCWSRRRGPPSTTS